MHRILVYRDQCALPLLGGGPLISGGRHSGVCLLRGVGLVRRPADQADGTAACACYRELGLFEGRRIKRTAQRRVPATGSWPCSKAGGSDIPDLTTFVEIARSNPSCVRWQELINTLPTVNLEPISRSDGHLTTWKATLGIQIPSPNILNPRNGKSANPAMCLQGNQKPCPCSVVY